MSKTDTFHIVVSVTLAGDIRAQNAISFMESISVTRVKRANARKQYKKKDPFLLNLILYALSAVSILNYITI